MSCLTRELQQRLTRYLKKNSDVISNKEPAQVRNVLVNQGLCPSDVTEDQMREIVRAAANH